MQLFIKKYYSKTVRKKMMNMGISEATIYKAQLNYGLLRPKALIVIINALAEIHNLDADDLLFECVNAITGDKNE
jgi:hypothetical protein